MADVTFAFNNFLTNLCKILLEIVTKLYYTYIAEAIDQVRYDVTDVIKRDLQSLGQALRHDHAMHRIHRSLQT